MKVISGYLKGRNILGYDINGTRPTMARVKESVFAIIQNNIEDTITLDLFCGSGQYGIEAISNGSKYCYFVDNNKEVIKVLNNNIRNLNIQDSVKVLNVDYLESLKYFKDNNIKFDLIFIDPPYKDLIINSLLENILKYDLLNKDGLIIVEYQKEILKEKYNNLSLIKSKKYSDKYINIYKNI